MAENYYDLLGVSGDATTAAIEDAYREEVKQVHPDVSDDVDASERTKRLNKAKRVLTDDDERARYDEVGHEAYTSGGPVDADDTPSGKSGTTSGTRRGRRSTVDSNGGHRYSGGSTGGSYGQKDRGRGSETTGGRANRPGSGSGSAAGSAYRSGSVSGSSDRWPGREDRRGSGQGRSVGSTGPTWQSGGVGQASASNAAGADGPSARRQAAAGTTDGPNADWSWNAWEQTRSWAVRQSDTAGPGFHPLQPVPTQGSFLLFLSTFFLYPFFVSSALFPPFPLVARALIALCTLLMFAYLLSVPETAVTVFGLWGVMAPVALVLLPGVSLFSFAGVVVLSVTWVPLAISVLTLSVLET